MTFRAERFHWGDDDVELKWHPRTEDKYNPDQPREPAGGPEGGQWTSGGGGGGEGGGGYEFVSPNVGSIKLPEAVKSIGGDRQRNLRAAAQEVNRGLGIDATTHNAVGAWADGAEHSLLSTVRKASWEKLKVAAAMKAHLADQKQTLVFQQDDAGKSLLYQFQVAEDVETLHQNLLADGVAFHTIVPHMEDKSVVDVYVADPDGSAHDAVAKAAERYDANVTYYTGQAEFIGTTQETGSDREQRDDARRNYEEIIQQSPVPESKEVWSGLHNYWGKELGLNYGLVPGDAEKFQALKARWAAINADMLQYVETRRPDAPEAQAGLKEMAALVKQMGTLHADPGGAAGIGLPGGPRDVVIIGAGPGGLTAALHGAAERLDTLLIDSNIVAGGQAKYTSRIENYGGFPLGVTGEHLTQDMLQGAERMGAEIKLGIAVKEVSHDPSTGLKTITLSNGEQIESRTVIIAAGVEFKKLAPFPGSEGPGIIYGGQNKDLIAAARGGAVCVIGGSNGAAQAALGCAEHCDHVYLMSRSPIEVAMSGYVADTVRANPKITVLDGQKEELTKVERDEYGNIQVMETNKGSKLPVNAIGVFIGTVPNTRWVPPEVEKTPSGTLVTNDDFVASIPGVFAVGDIRDKGVGRVIIAAGEGATALKHAVALLEEQKEAAGLVKADVATIYRDADTTAAMDMLIDRLLSLDLDNPWFGQTVEKHHASEN